jgi:apolipoprotein D and lipocalin family protein
MGCSLYFSLAWFDVDTLRKENFYKGLIMKNILFILLFSGFVLAQQNPPTTVKYVDLKKYVGLWYEVAKIPNSFQDQCVKNTTAKYTLTDDGEIKVTNSCIDEDGEEDAADGVVRVVDKKIQCKIRG